MNVRSAAALLLIAGSVLAAASSVSAAPGEVVGGPRLAEPGVVVDLSGGAAAPPELPVAAYVIADATTGEVLLAKNAHTPLRPASTLKTLTALTLIPLLEPETSYTAVFEDAAQDGSKVGLVPGAPYTVRELFYGMMLPSGNDAAHALANVAGGPAAATDLLNAEADRIGAHDTQVVNTSGLDAEGQVSSAYDLALIQANALQLLSFRAIYSAESFDFPSGPAVPGTPRPTYKIYTKNPLNLSEYPGTVGGKTGYTVASERTYVAAVERDGHLLVGAFMQYMADTEVVATTAFDWAFANRSALKPVGELVQPPEPSDGKSASASTESDATGAEDDSPRSGLLLGGALVAAGGVVFVGALVRKGPRRDRLDLSRF